MEIKPRNLIVFLLTLIPIFTILLLSFTSIIKVEAELVYDVDSTIVINDASAFKGFDMDSIGNLYVIDETLSTINKYDITGEFVLASAVLTNPSGLTVSDSDEVFVSVNGDVNQSVLRFDNGLSLIGTYDIAPIETDIGLRGLDVYNGFVYVVGQYSNIVYSIDLFDGTVATLTNSALLSAPVDVAIDPSGVEVRLYVVTDDDGFNEIFYCDLYDCGATEGSYAGESDYPFKIAVDNNGYVYVLDYSLPGLQIYDSSHAFVENLVASNTVKDVFYHNNRLYLLESPIGNRAVAFYTVGFPTPTDTPTDTPTPTEEPTLNNDDFENAIVIELNNTSYANGVIENSTIQVDEPTSLVYDKITAINSVWWQFTAPSSTKVSIDTCDQEYGDMDTMIAVYAGDQLNNLIKIIDNELGCSGAGAKVIFDVLEAQTYHIQVSIRNLEIYNEVLPIWFNFSVTEEPTDPIEPLANDDFENAIEVQLDQLNGDGEYVPFSVPSTRNSTMQIGEPDAGKYVMDPRSIWWKWTNDGTAREIWIDTCDTQTGNMLDSLLSVYTGSSVDNLTLVAENDDFVTDISDANWWCNFQNQTSFLTFQALPNTTYYVRFLDISNRNGPGYMTLRNRPAFYENSLEAPPGDYWCSNHGGIARTIPYGMSDDGSSWEAWEQCWAWCQANMTEEFPICQDNGDSKRACWLNRTPEGGMDNCEWVEPSEGWAHPMGSYVGEVGGYLLTLEDDLRATLISNLDMDVTVFRQLGERGIYVLDADDSMIMANVGVLFDANHDWTSLRGEVDMIQGKVFIGDPSSEPGAIGSYNLMAPILESDPSEYLLLCPLAESILDVSDTCPGGTIVSELDPNVSVVTGTDTNRYWMVEDLTQSMGALNYTIPYAPVCGNQFVDEDEQCDGINLGGFECSSFPGYNSGDLLCNESCNYNIEQCTYVEPTIPPTATPSPAFTTTPTVTLVQRISTPVPTPSSESICFYVNEQGVCIEDLEIYNVRTSTENGTIEICWDTNAPSIGVVKYGYRGLMDRITLPETEEKLLNHCFVLSDIEYGKLYDYKIDAQSKDAQASYLGNFDMKQIGSDSQCRVNLNRDYTLDVSGNLSFSFSTDNTSSCTLSFGKDSLNMNSVGTITPYSSMFKGSMNVGLGNRSDVFLKVNCVSIVNQCSASDIISAKTIANMLDEGGLLSTQNKSLISNYSIALALIGLILGIIPLLFTSPYLFMYGFFWFIPRKKKQPWGVVYDAIENKPIPFAVIRIFDLNGQMIKQTVTDLEGKYSFVLDRGNYRMEAVHSDYALFNKEVLILKKESQVALDMALKKNGQTSVLNMKQLSYSMLTAAGWIITVVGLFLSIIALILNTSLFNTIIMALYIVQIGMLFFLKPVKNWGFIYDKKSGERIKGVFLRVFDKDQGRQIELQMSDEKGRFGFRLPKGNYYLGISSPGYEIESNSSLITLPEGTKVFDIGDGKINDIEIGLVKTA